MTVLAVVLIVAAVLAAWLVVSVAVALLVGPVLKRLSKDYPQQGEAERKADGALLGDLADALEERRAAEPVARAADRAWRQRRAAP